MLLSDLARASGVSIQTVSRIEAGRGSYGPTRTKIAAALGVSIDTIAEFAAPPAPLESPAPLRAHRAAARLSLAALGELVDLHPSVVSGIERGRWRASTASAERIAAALGVPHTAVAELTDPRPDRPDRGARWRSDAERPYWPHAEVLRTAMRGADVTADGLAATLGIVSATVSTWVSGRSGVPAYWWAPIADVLGDESVTIRLARAEASRWYPGPPPTERPNPRSVRRWTADEDATIAATGDRPLAEVAELVGRTVQAVRYRRRHLVRSSR